MDEAGGILIDADTGADERGVIGLGEKEYQFFIRDAGSDDTHIDASFSRHAQLLLHFIVDNQVGGGDVYIIGGIFEDIHIYIFAQGDIVQGRVGVGLYVASLPALEGGAGGKIFIPGGIRVADKIPHFQKHYGMASYGVAFQADSGVLPVSVGMGDVKIFVSQVKASGIADPVVDYRQNIP